MEPAAGLVELAARRPARECLLGDRPSVPTRYSHRVPCCGLPRPTSRRTYTIPGIARQSPTRTFTPNPPKPARQFTSVAASSNFYEDGDSQHPRLQPIPSCLRRTFSNRATGSYPVFSVKLKTGGKIRVVPCSTVWLCQSGTRAPLRRRPFRSPSGRNLGKLGPVPERTAPLTHELGVAATRAAQPPHIDVQENERPPNRRH